MTNLNTRRQHRPTNANVAATRPDPTKYRRGFISHSQASWVHDDFFSSWQDRVGLMYFLRVCISVAHMSNNIQVTIHEYRATYFKCNHGTSHFFALKCIDYLYILPMNCIHTDRGRWRSVGYARHECSVPVKRKLSRAVSCWLTAFTLAQLNWHKWPGSPPPHNQGPVTWPAIFFILMKPT